MTSFKLKQIFACLIGGALTLSLFMTSVSAATEPVGGITDNSSSVKEGTLETFNLKMVQFSDGRIRKISVWLPKGYNQKNKSRTYPVIYLQDGQEMFGSTTNVWGVDESISYYVNKGYQGSIVVAVDNGEEKRMKELIDLTPMNGDKGDGDNYANFIVKTLKPYIDAHYNTKPQREFTTVGGSSAGGHMAFVLAMEHPDIFGYSIILSPAAISNIVSEYLKSKDFSNLNHDPYLFIYTGGSTKFEADIEQYAKYFYSELIKDGYPKSKINFQVNERNDHNNAAWRPYFKIAYKWTLDHPYTSIANAKEISPNHNNNNNAAIIYLPFICIGSGILLITVFIPIFIHTRRPKKKKCKPALK